MPRRACRLCIHNNYQENHVESNNWNVTAHAYEAVAPEYSYRKYILEIKRCCNNNSSSNRSSISPWHTPSSFSNKSHNSALVTGSDEDGLIIQPIMVEQYEL